eukprot:2034854-Amphidinium_carterae.1
MAHGQRGQGPVLATTSAAVVIVTPQECLELAPLSLCYSRRRRRTTSVVSDKVVILKTFSLTILQVNSPFMCPAPCAIDARWCVQKVLEHLQLASIYWVRNTKVPEAGGAR